MTLPNAPFDQPVRRIIDANANRARETLRVIEEHARFAQDDATLAAHAKQLRHDLAAALAGVPQHSLLAARDTPGDVGTRTATETERTRENADDVAIAAAKRLTEALRAIEEYGKTFDAELGGRVEQLRYRAYELEKQLGLRMHLARRFESVRLYVLVTSEMCGRPVLDTVRAVLDGGADCVQLREKQLDDGELLALAGRVRELTRQAGALFVMNDRPDLAVLAHADGVHVGDKDLPIAAVRRIVGADLIVGRSTHTIEEARQAARDGADYVAVGPMYPTTTKVRPVMGPGLLRAATAEITRPVVAIGGITVERLPELVDSGGRCVAVSSRIISSDDPRAEARAFSAFLRGLPDNPAAGRS